MICFAADDAQSYAVPGESYLDVLDGLYDSAIETIVCRQEGGAGFMALAEGRLTGVPGIAMVTRGPGAANAMIAVHTAWQDATALVLFVGLVPVADRARLLPPTRPTRRSRQRVGLTRR